MAAKVVSQVFDAIEFRGVRRQWDQRDVGRNDEVVRTVQAGSVPDHRGVVYHYRWTIEMFFRSLKHLLGCRHLLSHNHNGIEIQPYCAIIACLLISLWTARKPSRSAFPG